MYRVIKSYCWYEMWDDEYDWEVDFEAESFEECVAYLKGIGAYEGEDAGLLELGPEDWIEYWIEKVE